MRYGQLFAENLNDVTMTSSPISFLWVYLSDIPNFISIEITRELRYKVGKLTENYEEKMGITSL